MIETRPPAVVNATSAAVAQLSANESPLGPPRLGLTEAIRGLESLHRYPRAAHQALTNRLAEAWETSPHNLVLTNGVDEAIDLITSLVDSVWCTVPGFDAFWTRPQTQGMLVTRIPLDRLGRPTVRPERVGPAGVAFIARPNNPTGTVVDESWVAELPGHVEFVFVDETYIDFSRQKSFLPRTGEWSNLCVFRSLSKSLGLAGLRIGAIVAPPLLAAQLREKQRFYPVDTLALEVAAAAVTDVDYVAGYREYVLQQRAKLLGMLRDSDLFIEVQDTEANFVIARCPDPATAVSLEGRLAEQGAFVHECTHFGYPGRLRISVGTHEEIELLRRSLAYISATQRANE